MALSLGYRRRPLEGKPPNPIPTQTKRTGGSNAVIYEIYPRSFEDSNSDGIGDLNGHHRASRLPEVRWASTPSG